MNQREQSAIYRLAQRLYPLCRSITGEGLRATLRMLREVCPALTLHEVPTGTRAFDWTVPKEWNVREAYVDYLGDGGGVKRVIDFKRHNLHLVGYSTPIDTVLSLEELQEHLYSIPEKPDVIPYVTSYYKERFGFCLAHNARLQLLPGRYHVVVDGDLKDGSMTYGELLLPGESEREILFSTYVCHPSMANNELSGPCVAIHLARWLSELPHRRFSYRFVFLPETIGSIVYLSRHLDALKQNVEAGFVLSCLGDPGHFSLVASRYGNTLADRAAKNVLHALDPAYRRYSFLDRGSDERQYCAPGVDLPVCCLTRTKFGEYPEYHTSADDLNFITAEALEGSLAFLKELVAALEANRHYRVGCLCEPKLSERGLYPDCSTGRPGEEIRILMNFIAYCDGSNDLFAVSDLIGVPVHRLTGWVDRLTNAGLLAIVAEKEQTKPQ